MSEDNGDRRPTLPPEPQTQEMEPLPAINPRPKNWEELARQLAAVVMTENDSMLRIHDWMSRVDARLSSIEAEIVLIRARTDH